MASLSLHFNVHLLSSISKVRHGVFNSALRGNIPSLRKPAAFKIARLSPPFCMSVEIDGEKDDLPPDLRRGLEERFVVVNTGQWECRSCSYIYDQTVGDPSYPVAAGTEFEKLPDDWRCPTCGAAKFSFTSKSVELAGFAQNQKFGLGTNSLTSGQKSLLIYGALLFFFLLFLSGYFIQ